MSQVDPTVPHARAGWGALGWVRALGLVVFAVVCVFVIDGAYPPLRPNGPPRFSAGTVARFDAWRSDVADGPWDGCRLQSVSEAAPAIVLGLVCDDAPDVRVALTPLSVDSAARAADDCASEAGAGQWARCSLTGAPSAERAAQLTAIVSRNLDVILPLNPVQVTLVREPRADDDGFQLLRPLRWSRDDAALSLVSWALLGFLWLGITGAFDARRWARRDLWVLVPLAAALFLRLWVVPASVQEIELQLYDGLLPTRHSYFVPLLGRLLRVLPGDAAVHAFQLSGLLGALAVLPLFRFVEARLESAKGAALVAVMFACHPVVARFTPTDGPYGLMMLAFFQAVYWLGVPTPRSVVAGLTALALAVACRADGFLLLPVAALLIGPRAWVSIATTSRRELVIGGGVAAGMLAWHAWTVLPQVAHVSVPVLGLKRIVTEALWSQAALGETPTELLARRSWTLLAVVGGLVSLLRPSWRWATAALCCVPLLAAPYPLSWTWVVAIHRLVPAAVMLSLAAGAALAALVVDLDHARPRVAAVVTGALLAVPITLTVAQASFLTRLWSFNVQWEMVRGALAPGGVERPECPVLVFGANDSFDLDMHDFGQMLFSTEVINCQAHDCVARARDGGCYRYVRALAAYNADYRAGDPCRDPALTAEASVSLCRKPACVEVERALSLRPIVEQPITPDDSFPPGDMASYPTTVRVGVYDVAPVAR